MHHLIGTIAGVVFTLSLGQPLWAGEHSSHPLIGEWLSNKEASIRELSKAGLSSQEIEKISFLYGSLVLDIKKNTYTTILDGEISEMPYSIISTTNNCYKIKLDQDTSELCIINNELYVPSYKGSKEVFTRKI